MSRVFLIILFSVVFGDLVTNSFQPVIEMVFQISEADSTFSFWGDAYWTRIIASLLGTIFGGFIIGSHLKGNGGSLQEFALILYSLPIVFFWGFNLLVYYTHHPINLFLCTHLAGSFFESFPPYTFFVPEFSLFSFWHIVPLLLTIFSVPAAYLGAYISVEFKFDFSESKNVLNIPWYHWLWLYFFCIWPIIATSSIFFVSLIDSNIAINIFDNFPINLRPTFGSIFIIGLLFYFSYNLYCLLSDNIRCQIENKIYKWFRIICIVFFFNFLYNFIF